MTMGYLCSDSSQIVHDSLGQYLCIDPLHTDLSRPLRLVLADVTAGNVTKTVLELLAHPGFPILLLLTVLQLPVSVIPR